jgi:uncharacterized protein
MRGDGQLGDLFLYDPLQVLEMLYRKISYLGNSLFDPKNSEIDWKLVLGAACFGLGWGIGGLCPGPAIMQLAVFTVPVHILWLGCLFLGMLLARKLEQYLQRKVK